MDGKHKCIADGCTELIPTDKTLCTKHWHKVPDWMREKIREKRDSGDWVKYSRWMRRAVKFIRRKEDGTLTAARQ